MRYFARTGRRVGREQRTGMCAVASGSWTIHRAASDYRRKVRSSSATDGRRRHLGAVNAGTIPRHDRRPHPRPMSNLHQMLVQVVESLADAPSCAVARTSALVSTGWYLGRAVYLEPTGCASARGDDDLQPRVRTSSRRRKCTPHAGRCAAAAAATPAQLGAGDPGRAPHAPGQPRAAAAWRDRPRLARVLAAAGPVADLRKSSCSRSAPSVDALAGALPSRTR